MVINRHDQVGNLADVDVGKDSMCSHGYIKFLRDEVGCAYQAVGFDNSANYVP